MGRLGRAIFQTAISRVNLDDPHVQHNFSLPVVNLISSDRTAVATARLHSGLHSVLLRK
jgi:hypothetical protein